MNPGPAEPEAGMLPSEPARRAYDITIRKAIFLNYNNNIPQQC